MTCVLIIDDHPIVLQGCRQLLEDAGVDQIVQAQSLAWNMLPFWSAALAKGPPNLRRLPADAGPSQLQSGASDAAGPSNES